MKARIPAADTGWVFGVLDQGLQSGFNLLLIVYVSKYLGIAALGMYATVSVLLFASRALEDAIVLRPMTVLGPRSNDPLGSYLAVTARMQAALLVLVASAGALLGSLTIAVRGDAGPWLGALLACAVCVPAQGMANWGRRAFYLLGRPAGALMQTAAATTTTATALALWHGWKGPSVPAVFLCSSLGGVAALASTWNRLPPGAGSNSTRGWREWIPLHWNLGRWVLFSLPFSIAMYQGYYVLVSLLINSESSGVLKSMDAIVAPFEQVLIALTMVLTPEFAREFDRSSGAMNRRRLTRTWGATLGMAAAYSVVTWFAGPWILDHVFSFGPSASALAGAVLPLLVVLPLLKGLAYPPSIVVTAAGRTDHVFRAYLFASLATFGIGIPAIWSLGLKGAVLGIAVAVAIHALVLTYLSLRLTRR